MEEKRKHKRLDLDVSIQLEKLDDDKITTLKLVHVDVTDISRSGVGFVSDQKLELGSFYDTKIQIWTREIINAVLEIVRCEPHGDGSYKYGCTFIGMTDTDALKIDIYQIFNDV
ncbi:MAG: PilZ domain-containing protein [Lachnospiraceae bacterium]|nr:PilZ domain-containing protein [Lachnospiraceae bacterium]